MAARRTGTGRHPLADFRVLDIGAIGGNASLGIDLVIDILEHSLGGGLVLAGDAVELPKYARLAHGQHVFLASVIDHQPLEHFVEVQRLARRVGIEPFELAGIRVQRQRGVGVQGRALRRAAGGARPGLGLGGTPIGRVAFRIVGAGDPGFAALAEFIGNAVPTIAARLALQRDSLEAPSYLASLGIIGADETVLGLEAIAVCQPHQDLAMHRDGAAGVAVAFLAVLDLGLPHDLAGLGVQAIKLGVGGGHEHLVAIQRQRTGGAIGPGGCRSDAVFPKQFASLGIQSLHRVSDIG